jgi:curved DNA-binding protein CbpA
MLTPYRVLGLPADCSDEAIRNRYLEWTKLYPPSRHPKRFGQIAHAYEQIKDHRRRVVNQVLGGTDSAPWQEELELLITPHQDTPRAPTLRELVEAKKR